MFAFGVNGRRVRPVGKVLLSCFVIRRDSLPAFSGEMEYGSISTVMLTAPIFCRSSACVLSGARAKVSWPRDTSRRIRFFRNRYRYQLVFANSAMGGSSFVDMSSSWDFWLESRTAWIDARGGRSSPSSVLAGLPGAGDGCRVEAKYSFACESNADLRCLQSPSDHPHESGKKGLPHDRLLGGDTPRAVWPAFQSSLRMGRQDRPARGSAPWVTFEAWKGRCPMAEGES